jgi:hypothetical protein
MLVYEKAISGGFLRSSRLAGKEPAMKFKRRLGQLVFAVLTASASGGFAATLFADAVSDLTKYFMAASALVLRASTGLDNAKFDAIPAAQRDSARTQLQTLGDQLQLIFLEQTTLVSQLDFFVDLAKDPSKTDAQKKNFWDHSVLPRIRTVQEAVSQVRTFSDKAGQPFSVALSTEDRLALGDTLAARSAALKTFGTMAPPASADELLRFEGLIEHYKTLMSNLFNLRRAIDDALRRLSSA